MITKFEQYSINEGIVTNFKFIRSLFPDIFKLAIINIKKMHEKITEDHIVEFIVHYVLNNYGVDISNFKDMYMYAKIFVHRKAKKEKILDEN